jgi:small subunit ribosomal protein S9
MADDAVNPEETPEETPATPEQPEAVEAEAAAPAAEEAPAEPVAEEAAAEPVAEEAPAEDAAAEPVAEEAPAEQAAAEESDDDAEDEDETPRVKPAIPGADLEVDIVLEGSARSGGQQDEFGYYAEGEEPSADGESADGDEVDADQPIADVTIDLTAGARYTATGKRKSAVARVILTPGTGVYTIGGKDLETYFPRHALQRTIRQALEVVGYDTQLDVTARIHGGGVSAQAGALRHGISRPLIVAQPGLRGELKKRGFLTRDSRVKERKKAGLKKARKRPQFSKR